MIREILTFPDPRLKKEATDVKNIDGSLATLIEDMVETMYAAPGIGLAATQVGSNDRILVVDVNVEEKGRFDPQDDTDAGDAWLGPRRIVCGEDFDGRLEPVLEDHQAQCL